VGLLAALLVGLVLLFGTNLIGFVPRFVLGGLVLYLGIDFLADWVWLSCKKLPIIDYSWLLPCCSSWLQWAHSRPLD
jgi:SulP family sulfate permease